MIQRVAVDGVFFRVEALNREGSPSTTVRVTVPALYVEEFFNRRRWPGVTVPPARSYWFEFERFSGDLVDHNVPARYDGYPVVALSEVAGSVV